MSSPPTYSFSGYLKFLTKQKPNSLNIFIFLWAVHNDLRMLCVLTPNLTYLLPLCLYYTLSQSSPFLFNPSDRYHHCCFIQCFDLAIFVHYLCVLLLLYLRPSIGIIFLPEVHPIKFPLVQVYFIDGLSVFLMVWTWLYFPFIKEYFHWTSSSRLTYIFCQNIRHSSVLSLIIAVERVVASSTVVPV